MRGPQGCAPCRSPAGRRRRRRRRQRRAARTAAGGPSARDGQGLLQPKSAYRRGRPTAAGEPSARGGQGLLQPKSAYSSGRPTAVGGPSARGGQGLQSKSAYSSGHIKYMHPFHSISHINELFKQIDICLNRFINITSYFLTSFKIVPRMTILNLDARRP